MHTTTTRARFARLVVPLVFLSAATAGCDIAMAHLNEKETAKWHQTYQLQPGGRVEISNVNGKIDVEPSTGNTVDVTAVKKARGAGSREAAKAALERDRRSSRTYPRPRSRSRPRFRSWSGGLINGGNQQVRIHVKVPAGAEVKFTTVNGGIEITGLQGTDQRRDHQRRRHGARRRRVSSTRARPTAGSTSTWRGCRRRA